MVRCVAFLSLSFLLAVGCGSDSYPVEMESGWAYRTSSSEQGNVPSSPMMGGMGGMELLAEGDGAESESLPDNRKIIYTADLSIVVENFDPVETAIAKLVKKFGGFIADSTIDTQNKQSRRGDWTVRIPVATFDDFLNETGSIGVPVSRSQNAQDVTEEYVDVEARIVNKKKLEARILELLGRPDDKIQHVIEVEKELGRVREEIERMEGRIRYLKDKVELTTVNISIWEEKEYQPPQAKTFSNRVSSAWNQSVTRSQRGIEDAAVWGVGNIFPIVFWLIVGIVAYFVCKRFYRKWRPVASE